MIAVLKTGVEKAQQENLINWLEGMGLKVNISEGDFHTVLGLIGDTSRVDMDLLEGLEIVESVRRISEPYKKANRKFFHDDSVVDVSGVKIGKGNFAMIAGPCSIESEEQIILVEIGRASCRERVFTAV